MDIAIIFATPVLLLSFGLLLTRLRRLSPVEDLGFRLPAPQAALLWLFGFLLLALAQEWISRAAGMESSAGSWKGKYDAFDLAIRIVAVALVYPVAEEFFFRGALLGTFRQRFGTAGAVIGSSAIFALVHVQYDWRGMTFIAADALFFALCRVRAGSLYLVMLMHVLGNSYAVWERTLG